MDETKLKPCPFCGSKRGALKSLQLGMQLG